ncbi:Excinuclease ABC subunit C [Fibrobacter sp. UWB15]|uniref:excinuclease ABC subunit UvrC n=1 Tax=unclassified Fibrobacter TaxID=2634177 RepID=UPI00091D8DFE|nr:MULTISPECIES: excinuclease ABC subunit UvrC [unclassified Fibrobacter]PWJ66553.1 excinuclease ABC subunit C [Fibrobacter sp. UWB6]SHG00542.1 Excinuclease ABC subunit C [Fibrobacter sp. UWB8]SMG22737.1 Excinuclease ABC subunit C [Fibrobacter sp. UWB15]
MISVNEHIQRRLTELPDRPGVYIMKNAQGKIIYIGKAKVLKNRVRSYFDGSEHNGHRAATLMLPYIRDIEWIITESEQEALILEANLIRKHTPKYNVLLKDDKHFPYLAFSVKEPFPRLSLSRSVKKDGRQYFGPYMSSRYIDKLIDIAARLFKIRECSMELPAKHPVRPCLNYHIGRCSAPCAGLITQEEYAKDVESTRLMLEGKRDDLIDKWQREMEEASERLDFETAMKKRDAIQALQASGTHQKTDTTDPNLSLDVVTLRRNGDMAAAVILEYRKGVLMGRRHYRLECKLEDDETEIFRQMVLPWYMEAPLIPAEIATDIVLPEDRKELEAALSKQAGRKVTFSTPQRGEKLGFLKLAGANADMILVEMRAEVQKYSEIDQSVFELQKVLGLKKTPFRIECVDISHLSGTNTVASLVAFKNGRPDKANYRKFIIKTVEGVDDFASMREVMTRRIRRLENEGVPMPDLWVCDGGKGQVDATMQILKELGHDQDLPLIGLAKRLEEIVFPDDRKSIVLHRTSPALKLLQNARDEAHRFAITYQRSKRKKDLEVEWLKMPGVGHETRVKILSKYRSAEAFMAAPIEDIEILLGKVRGNNLRDQVAKYCADFIRPSGLDDNKDSEG